jgi:hypothetical protein
MDTHEITLTPVADKDGATLYELTVITGPQTSHRLYTHRVYGTLEAAIDSVYPPISARVRSHIVEGIRGEGKPVVFYLEDSFQEQ